MRDFSLQGIKAKINQWVVGFLQLRELFGTSKDVYGDLLGVDLEDSSVISILLKNPLGGTIRVSRAAVVGLPSGTIVEDIIVDNALLTVALKKMIEKARTQSMNAVVAMPGSKVVIKQIKLDTMLSDADAEARAWQEARKTFPEIAKNLYLDFAQVEQFTVGKNKKYSLVLVATRKEDIVPRIEGLQQAGLVAKIVDVDYYALERAYRLFVSQLPTAHLATHTALIDFNPHSILFLVMHKKKAIYYNRQAYTGDVLIPFVQRAMDLEMAPVKSKPSLLGPIKFTPMQSDVRLNLDQDEVATIPFNLSEDQKSHVVMSIRRLFQSFYAENPGKVIEYVVMTGRCALLPDLTEHIGKMLDIPIIVANPLASLKIDDAANPEYILKLGPAFALSCGLAMRGIPVWI